MITKKTKNPQILVLIGALFIGATVYYFASSRPRIPDLPECRIETAELLKALEALSAQTKGFSPTHKEAELIADLERIHTSEVDEGLGKDQEQGAKLASHIADFRNNAIAMAERENNRYLLLGDYLAIEFQSALRDSLSLARAEHFLIKNESDLKNPVFSKAIHRGGAFLLRSFKCGAVAADGELRAHFIAPEVLFRVRWRDFAGLRLDLGFRDVERKVYYSFIAKYADKTSLDRRLFAINELNGICPGFDEVIARAVAMHESGDDQKARIELKNAVKKGRRENKLKNFEKALKD